MSQHHTNNPIALRALMSETIFAERYAPASRQKNEDRQAEPILVAAAPSPEGGGEEGKDGGLSFPSGDGGTKTSENRAQPKPVEAAASETPRETFAYRGDKTTGFLFVLRNAESPYFSPRAEEAFAKMLGALRLTPQNVAVVNLANADNPNDFGQLMAFFQPKKITLLGVAPASLNLPEIPQNAHKKGKKAVVFYTFGFEEMLDDANRKKAFWTAFKTFMAV